MILACMMAVDEDALFCDLAETYHIFGLESLPIESIARLSVGLRDNSRIKQKLSNVNYPSIELMMVNLTDTVSMFRYGFTEDAQKHKNMPYLFCNEIMTDETITSSGFESGEAFLDAWREFNEV